MEVKHNTLRENIFWYIKRRLKNFMTYSGDDFFCIKCNVKFIVGVTLTGDKL